MDPFTVCKHSNRFWLKDTICNNRDRSFKMGTALKIHNIGDSR